MKVDRVRIGEEAAALANRHGFDGVSMNDLADALQVRTPSLYSHVTGIDEVKRLISLRCLAELEQGAARATIGKSGPDAIRALLSGYRNFARRNPGAYAAILLKVPAEDTEWRAAMDRLKETCMAALQGYGLQGAEVVHALRGMRSVAHGFASLEAAGALKHSVSPDDSYAWLVETFLAGLESMASLRRKKLRSPTGTP